MHGTLRVGHGVKHRTLSQCVRVGEICCCLLFLFFVFEIFNSIFTFFIFHLFVCTIFVLFSINTTITSPNIVVVTSCFVALSKIKIAETFQKILPWPFPLHKKWSFPLKISSVNLTKSIGNYWIGHIYWTDP